MNCFFFSLFALFLSVVVVVIKQSSSTPTNDLQKRHPSEKSSILDQILSITDKNQEDVDELRCAENWFQLNYSCYILSDYVSTVIQANHICDLLYWNNSRLMFIQQPVELLYAAYVLIKNNLNNLMLEVDRDLMKDGNIVNILSSSNYVQWEEFGKKFLQHRLNDKKEKIQLLRKDRSRDDNTIRIESTVADKDDMVNNNIFENLDRIRNPCHQIKWNVLNEDSNVLILTVEIISNKSICSLSNTDSRAAYSHLCQYMLDRCLNNIKCGKHERCINTQTDFNCSCSFLYTGRFCEKFSSNNIQLLIALPILLIAPLLLIKTTRKLLRRAALWFTNLFRRQRPPPLAPKDDEKDDEQSIQNHQTSPKEFYLSREERHLRSIFVLIFSVFFFLILISVPITRYFLSTEMNKTNSSQFDSLFNADIPNGRHTIFRIENFIFLIISILLTIIFTFLNTQDQSDDDNQSRIIEPIKSFYITDRFKTVAILMIQMFEILEILNETLIDISEASQSGILIKIFTRILFVIINAFRYYPVLTSLQFQDIKVRFLTFLYVISMAVFMIIRDNSHIYWLAFSKKIPLVYSVGKTGLYWLLIGYIAAELTVRLFYDSIYIARKNKRKITDKTYRKIEKYSFSKDDMAKCCLEKRNTHVTTGGNNIAASDNSEQQGCWISIRKFLIDYFRQFRTYITDVYKWEEDFRFTTIVISTYAIAFIFLFHLTYNLILLYTTDKSNYMTYLKHILERILNIDIKEQSFQGEVVFSAMITMIIYGLQLLHSIKNYKDNVRNLYNIYSARRIPPGKPDDHEIIPKSVQYPAFILRYLLGGFVICFNLIVFLLTISNVIRTRITSFKWPLISVISILFLYGLHQIINLTINKVFTSYGSKNENDLRLNRPYSILVYLNLISTSFIGVISSIIRLITSVLVNILFMPRIDYSCFVQPLQTLDSAHMAFQCFIHWEFLYTRDILLSLSTTTAPPSDSGLSPSETTAVELVQNEYVDAENNEDEGPFGSNPIDEVSLNNHDAQALVSSTESGLLHHRSLNYGNEPIPHNARSNADPEFTPLLQNEVSDSQV